MSPLLSNDIHKFLEQISAILKGDGTAEVRIQHALSLLNTAGSREISEISDNPHRSSSILNPTKLVASTKNNGSTVKGSDVSLRLIGESPAMNTIYEAIKRVGSSQATVLIRGESGTGKELVARAIHETSLRKEAPFVPIHCASLPDSLIESILFGYERGAFTGAIQTRRGKLDQASGGTLFLDEVGDIPVTTQVKLLRVIQEREYERVGGVNPLPANVRVIAATHRDLEAMVFSGSFREDLYYRLNVVPLTLPPLRERKEDITLLIEHFLERFNRENRRRVRLHAEVMAMLGRYHWPGNIRELQNCIERLVVLADSSTVTKSAIPKPLRSYIDHIRKTTSSSLNSKETKSVDTLPNHVRDLERERLIQVLEDVGWIKAKAARILGLTPRQVAYKMLKYDLHKDPTVYS